MSQPCIITAQCPADEWMELTNQPAASFGSNVHRGEVILFDNTVAFAFGRAVPADVLGANDPDLIATDTQIAQLEDIFTPIIYAAKALIQYIPQNSSLLFVPGQDVFFDVTAQLPVLTKANTHTFWIGRALSAKGVYDTQFLIEFDGRNPSRTHS